MTSAVRTLFVDRDGVINRMREDYVKSWDELELLPGAIESLASASKRGLELIVLSNQSAIGRGLVARETVDGIHRRIAALVAAEGGRIAAFLVCPHTPDDRCDCRKPAPGLLFRARDELGVDLSRAVMVGDQPTDVEAARAADCAAMLVGEDGIGAAIDLLTELPQVEDAIVLCGGLGTRLRGTLGPLPKAMATVHGRPFVDWLLLALASRGLRRAILATGHGASVIRDHFATGANLGLQVVLSEEPGPLGTGGASRLAAEKLDTSPVLVLNGDSYCTFNLLQLQLTHALTHANATLWLLPAERADRFGSVELAADQSVRTFEEKVGGSGLISAGVYLVELDALCDIPPNRPLSLERDLFPAWVGRGLHGVAGSGPFIDIGTPESLAAADSVLGPELAELEGRAWPNA
jgi:histidinol-phosphate phosphatase family protein